MQKRPLTPRQKFGVNLETYCELTNDNIYDIIKRTESKITLLEAHRIQIRSFIRTYRIYTPYMAGMTALEAFQYIEDEIIKEKTSLKRFRIWEREQHDKID